MKKVDLEEEPYKTLFKEVFGSLGKVRCAHMSEEDLWRALRAIQNLHAADSRKEMPVVSKAGPSHPMNLPIRTTFDAYDFMQDNLRLRKFRWRYLAVERGGRVGDTPWFRE